MKRKAPQISQMFFFTFSLRNRLFHQRNLKLRMKEEEKDSKSFAIIGQSWKSIVS